MTDGGPIGVLSPQLPNHKETQVSGTSDKVKGHVKQAVGEVTDDKDLESEGKVDELAGKAKDVVDTAKDKLTGKD